MAAVLDSPHRLAPFAADPFAVLYARFLEPLQRFFTSYRLNTADVEDLTQEVFMRLAAPDLPRDLRKPDAFVFTLARNLVRDRARRLKTRAAATTVTLDEIDVPCGRPTPEQALEHEDQLQGIASALERLKPATRHAFFLHRVQGLPHAEIACELGVSVSMVEKHVMAAIAALRTLDA